VSAARWRDTYQLVPTQRSFLCKLATADPRILDEGSTRVGGRETLRLRTRQGVAVFRRRDRLESGPEGEASASLARPNGHRTGVSTCAYPCTRSRMRRHLWSEQFQVAPHRGFALAESGADDRSDIGGQVAHGGMLVGISRDNGDLVIAQDVMLDRKPLGVFRRIVPLPVLASHLCSWRARATRPYLTP
jgi:hypothetical protein